VENVKSKLDKGGVVGTIFLDLKKAYDTVDQGVLLKKNCQCLMSLLM